jgi:hypothetical protein
MKKRRADQRCREVSVVSVVVSVVVSKGSEQRNSAVFGCNGYRIYNGKVSTPKKKNCEANVFCSPLRFKP